MRVVLAVDSHATPAVDNDLDMCDVNVAVSVDEVLAENRSEELGRVNGVLFGKDVDSLLLGIGCDDGRVVCLCVAGVGQDKAQNTLMFGTTYDSSISPSRRVQTVISVTCCTPFSSRRTLNRRTLSLP